MEQFISALLNMSIEDKSDAKIKILRDKAWNKIVSGLGKEMTSVNLNGKSYSYNQSMTAIQIFSCATEALEQFRFNGRIKSVSFNFSNI